MYHHVNADKFSNTKEMIAEHLQFIHSNCNVVLPGDPLSATQINVCLVFDDAGFDFFFYVFPLLKQLTLKVLLAVPTKYIVESASHIPDDRRLHVPVLQHMHDHIYSSEVPFCTWEELRILVQSGLVHIASHSHSHSNLIYTKDFEYEAEHSKVVLENKLEISVNSFVFPYGDFNNAVVTTANKFYTYLFSAGGGDNTSWAGIDGVLFRLYGDDMRDATALLNDSHILKYKLLFPKLKLKKWLKDRQRFIFQS